MGIEAQGGKSIESISLSEAGDYSLFSLGGDLAIASVSAVVYLDIIEVDGVGIDPVKVQANLTFSPSGGLFELSTTGRMTSAIWNGELTIDVAEALQNQGITGNATKVSLTLTDTLAAASVPLTASHIGKSDLDIACGRGSRARDPGDVGRRPAGPVPDGRTTSARPPTGTYGPRALSRQRNSPDGSAAHRSITRPASAPPGGAGTKE